MLSGACVGCGWVGELRGGVCASVRDIHGTGTVSTPHKYENFFRMLTLISYRIECHLHASKSG